MNKENILQEAKKIFFDIESIDTDIYKAKLKLGGEKPAAIYWLDMRDKMIEDFSSYQTKLLNESFFSSEKYLQWNNYLIILRDEYDKRAKEEIEKNDKYARKYIFNEKEFIDFFTLEKSKGTVESNIVFKWKDILNKSNLHEVYGEEFLTHLADRYINGNTIKGESDNEISEEIKNEVERINSIDYLSLTNEYRPYPKPNKEFEFGKANLIFGANGVGKTSILEAIELLICGKNLRNPKKIYPDNCFSYEVNNKKTQINYKNLESSEYRSRDENWYSNSYPKGNNLQISFNRYNYFNTDAAYAFANSNNAIEIREALYNLILGKEYNHIKERSKKTLVIFKREKKTFETKRKEYEELITQLNSDLKIEESNNYNKEITSSIIKTSFKFNSIEAQNDLDKNIDKLELELNNAVSFLKQIKLKASNKTNTQEIEKNSKEIEVKLKSLIDFDSNNKSLKKKNDELKKIKNNFLEKQELIKNCDKYFKNHNFFKLEEKEKEYDILRLKENQASLIKSQYLELSTKILDSEESFEKSRKRNNEEIKKLEVEKQEIRVKIDQQLKVLDERNALLSEIKDLGIRYIINNPNVDKCPMCETQFSSEELSNRIRKSLKQTDLKSNISWIDKLTIVERSLSEKSNYKVNLERLSQIFSLLDSKKTKDYPIKEMLKSIQSEVEKIDSYKTDLLALEEFNKSAEQIEVSISEFNQLNIEFKKLFPSVSFEFSNKRRILDEGENTKNKLNELDKELEEIEFQISELKTKFLEYHSLDVKIDLNELQTNLKNSLDDMNAALKLIKELNAIFKVEPLDNFDNLEVSLNNLSLNIKTYKEQLSRKKYVEKTKARILNGKDLLKKNQSILNRIELGIKSLQKIEDENDSEVEKYLTTNMLEIVDIFKAIHSPKEFIGIKFDKKTIHLIDSNNKKRNLSEISTGQRSALALSIFVSLNRKLKSPSVIMFDDPVSFIDDFNALSFLDFMRYFVIRENKQIFMATANKKLATLFKKKFNHLEDDFKVYELTRSTTS